MLCRIPIAIMVWIGLAACPVEPATIPTPESHFGHKMGMDRTVLDWDRVVEYFRKLQQSSDRLLLKELGKSTEGRPFILVTISAPANLRNLDRYRWIQGKLADPRRTPPAEAERLIAEGKMVVLITCSIHATEIASTHTAVEFAHLEDHISQQRNTRPPKKWRYCTTSPEGHTRGAQTGIAESGASRRSPEPPTSLLWSTRTSAAPPNCVTCGLGAPNHLPVTRLTAGCATRGL